jgi:hypothetical protein
VGVSSRRRAPMTSFNKATGGRIEHDPEACWNDGQGRYPASQHLHGSHNVSHEIKTQIVLTRLAGGVLNF